MKVQASVAFALASLSIGLGCGDDTGSGASALGGGGSDIGGAAPGGGGALSDGGGGAAAGGSGATGGNGGNGGNGGAGGSEACEEDCSALGLECCAGQCVGKYNDILNCGFCGNECGGEHPYCNQGLCAATPPCEAGEGGGLPAGQFCCGATACDDGDLCCTVPGPGPSGGPACFAIDRDDPTTQTCLPGCPQCD